MLRGFLQGGIPESMRSGWCGGRRALFVVLAIGGCGRWMRSIWMDIWMNWAETQKFRIGRCGRRFVPWRFCLWICWIWSGQRGLVGRIVRRPVRSWRGIIRRWVGIGSRWDISCRRNRWRTVKPIRRWGRFWIGCGRGSGRRGWPTGRSRPMWAG